MLGFIGALTAVEQLAPIFIRFTPDLGLDLDPIALARAVGSIFALRDDAFDTAFLALNQECQWIEERFREAHKAVVKTLQYLAQLLPPGTERPCSRIETVMAQKVETPATDILWFRALVVKRTEIRQPVRIARYGLCIDDDGLGRQMHERVRDGGKAAGENVPVAGVDRDVLAILVQLHAVAVEFDLMQPAVAFWRGIAETGLSGDDERRAWHEHNLGMFWMECTGLLETRTKRCSESNLR